MQPLWTNLNYILGVILDAPMYKKCTLVTYALVLLKLHLSSADLPMGMKLNLKLQNHLGTGRTLYINDLCGWFVLSSPKQK